MSQQSPTALVLTGGGARAAYQVGVLLAIAKLQGRRRDNPFPIICGTSAGAINAVGLACQAENFRKAVNTLAVFWRNMQAGEIYRTDPLGISATGARWLSALTLGWLVRRAPRSLLDNTPLATLLGRHMDLGGIERAIARGKLRAVSISASGYETGQNINFFQGSLEVQPWHRHQRIGLKTLLSVEHLLASSAIPFVFPAVRINREYFGDGSMRQLAPLSPAIHLGGERLLVIGTSRSSLQPERQEAHDYPTLAQIAGHAMSSIFLDGLAVDIERAQRINRTLNAIPENVRNTAGVKLRPIDTLVITPSERIEKIAASHASALPLSIKLLLGSIGAMNRNGGALTSYLLFEKPFTRALIDLGYADAQARADEIGTFLKL